jgi:hypothetical protein
MKMAAVKEAIQEAERFIKAAKKIKETTCKDCFGIVRKFDPYGADAAACKRASMDLTRALAKMRRS